MLFVVIEPDAIIQSDICEILTGLYEECRVVGTHAVEGIKGKIENHQGDVVAIVSVPSDEVNNTVGSLLCQHKQTKIVLVTNSVCNSVHDEAVIAGWVQRPFSNETLSEAVRSVIAAQPLVRS
ncbi:hypothetical protein Z946_1800 [Sulfitobacter noctilucicola]|uniref:DNA-binding NarL/FixJ family response regulator n=1 Tax=Sulfitobacter noctilucicola TaxID=1342301 RepID=A0A7W6Q1Y4_9RHOB|nr:hypothetical protein Z946_1800 [Sulfitobacter noctilucicola]MBB4172535.1 DNA-binding NarL/FixJ family response regulator [Sulfitobacter noctilucicola]